MALRMNTYSRREFIKMTSSTVALAAIGGTSFKRTIKDIPLGVQLYSVRHELDNDFRGTIRKLADMGFDGVEFADYHGLTATEIKNILDEHNLKSCGTHIYLDVLRGDSFEETVEFNKGLGNQNFIIRWIPEEDRDSRDSFLTTIDEYNEIARRLEPYGMRLGYHNHDYIFEKFDDDYLWDIMAENTDQRFIMQLDTGHAASVGIDPVELLQRHPGRTASMHVKAYSTENEAAIVGEDDLDWPTIIEVSQKTGGIEWYILEYEIEGVPPLEALEATIKNFRDLMGT